jgi:hypothetical protein
VKIKPEVASFTGFLEVSGGREILEIDTGKEAHSNIMGGVVCSTRV